MPVKTLLMRHQTFVNALIVGVTVLLTLAALEAVVRLGGETDADGQFSFMGHALHPYALPVNQLRGKIEAYLENQDEATLIYDEWLGWTYRPNSTRQSGTFTINSAGLRSRREYSQRPPPDTVRIALFGDSFTAGNAVSDDETWGHQLEMRLNQAGIRTEVLNFGVGGYGMDQAFLRWQKMGRDYAPDMVIFGFMPGDLDRNVKVFRGLRAPTGITFSRPRFVLTESGGLELVNSPTVPPEQLMTVFESFESHPLAKYENQYKSRDEAGQWWTSSRLASFLHAALTTDSPENYGPDSERGMLGQAIVDAFAADAKEHGAAFFALHLPKQENLTNFYKGIVESHQFLLDHFAAAYHYISFEERLDSSYLDDAYYPDGRHYGPELNSIAAQAVADEIQSCIESGVCELPRFEDRNVIFISASSSDST